MRAKEWLNVVYSDICGTLEVPNVVLKNISSPLWMSSPGCYDYFFIKAKSEALYVFKILKVVVTRKSGKMVKILRTVGGGEYNSKSFESFCARQGIIRKVTTPYTS